MTMTPSNGLPVSVDYTSRDYYALRADLIARVRANLPTWQGTDASDFGLVLVEAFSYMGDIANYYIDRMANEVYLPTATQRQSLLNIASLYGYTVTQLAPASVVLTFGNTSGSTLTLPAGTQVYADVVKDDVTTRVVFTTASSVSIPANTTLAGSTTTATAYNYALISTSSSYGIKLATSTNLPGQSYSIGSASVVDNTISVYTTADGITFSPWTKVARLSEANSTDTVFTVSYDGNNYASINFGDGVGGAIPSNDIYVQYGIGGGTVGNISATKISASYSPLLYVPGFSSSDLSTANSNVLITNLSSATGGTDPETNDSIRVNASKAALTNQRAVSLQDYAYLAASTPGVGKSNAVAAGPTSISVFVAPYRGAYNVESFPGRKTATTGTTPEMDAVIAVTNTSLSNRTQIGTTVTVNPPSYVRTVLKSNYTLASGYSEATVKASIIAALQSYFSYANVSFNQTVSVENLSKVISAVDGVATVAIQDWYKYSTGASGSTPVPSGTSLTSGDGGLFYLDTVNDLTLSVPTNIIISNLTANASSYWSLDQAYNANLYSYSISNVTGNSPIIVIGAPTIGGVSVSSPTLKINGTTYSYGTNITLPGSSSAGSHIYNVVVGNSTGSVTANYTITVNSGSYL